MKTKRVLRYYCDFCKKAGQSKYWMGIHEKVCTKNPNRICRLCKNPVKAKEIADEFIGAKDDWTYPISDQRIDKTLKDIEKACHSCPNCMLAVIRQSQVSPMVFSNFDYKKALEHWWHEVREEDRKQEEWDAIYG